MNGESALEAEPPAEAESEAPAAAVVSLKDTTAASKAKGADFNALNSTHVEGAGTVLHSPPHDHPFDRVVIFIGGLGTTAARLIYNGRRRAFEEAGYALVFADQYNEGARRDTVAEPKSNRSGWSKCQKNLFWRAIHRSAESVPQLVDFCLATYGAGVKVAAYGASMGGDIFLTSLQFERRLTAVVLERATPDWRRPGSVENVLGESAEGDELYRRYSPCNRLEAYHDHPTAILFICGERCVISPYLPLSFHALLNPSLSRAPSENLPSTTAMRTCPVSRRLRLWPCCVRRGWPTRSLTTSTGGFGCWYSRAAGGAATSSATRQRRHAKQCSSST